MRLNIYVLAAFALFLSIRTTAQVSLVVKADKPVADIQPTMWGIFFEDINFAADGGLYAEMIKNRSFEFPMPMTGWKEIRNNGAGKILIENSAGNGDTRYGHMRIDATGGAYGLANEGCRGM